MSKKKEREEPPILTSKVIRITESGKFFLLESASQGFGFGNLAQGFILWNTQRGIQNPRLIRFTSHGATPA